MNNLFILVFNSLLITILKSIITERSTTELRLFWTISMFEMGGYV